MNPRMISMFNRARDAFGWAVLLPLIGRYRRWWPDTKFAAITGSCGKTTAKYLAQAVLESTFQGRTSPRGVNQGRALLRTIPILRPGHRFCLIELGASGEGTLGDLARWYHPDIAAITCVGHEHISAFSGLESIAREKALLLKYLTGNGTAVLNWDDPFVRGMSSRCNAKVISVGTDSDATLRAENISSHWPERLSFQLLFEGQEYPVQTRLCGEHWITSVLIALGIGVAAGVPIDRAVEAVSTVDPVPRRMEAIRTRSGFDLIRDDWKGSSWTLPLVFDFLAKADARRKILVIGQISDDKTKPRRLYHRVASAGRETADLVCLYGHWASHGLKARKTDQDDSVLSFENAQDLFKHLEAVVMEGDLVFVKASGKKDRLLEEALSEPFWRAG